MALILVIDDDELVRRSIVRILENAGHRVVDAADGRQGILLLEEHKPDLVVTDIVMPNQEGIETIMEMRATSELPVIAMSGVAPVDGHDLLVDAKLLGADAILHKPLGITQLLQTVEDLLKSRGR